MADSLFAALLYNTALLLALVLIFDLATSRFNIDDHLPRQFAFGLVIGLIGLGIMTTSFPLPLGVVFDARSVLLSMSGLFFGAIPTAVALVLMGAYHLWVGSEAITGLAVIAASGTIGIIWRHYRARPLDDVRPSEIYLLGLAVHAVMLALMLTLPRNAAMHVLANISLPVIIIYPLAGVALGSVLANRLRREKVTERLRESEALYRSLVDCLPQNIYRIDRDGRITFANRVFLESLQTTMENLQGRTVYDLYPPELAARYRAADTDVMVAGEVLVNTEEDEDPLSGETRHVDIIKSPIRSSTGEIEGLQCIFSDITDRKVAAARIHRLAFFDTLTGLANRSLLMDRLAQSLAIGRRLDRVEAVMLLNIDRFKIINDVRGYVIGDALLAQVGARLQTMLRTSDTLARMAGDEFGILLPDTANQHERASRRALAVAEKIHNGLRRPFEVDGEEFALCASIGITLFPASSDETPDAILRRADTALHRAKASGGEQTAFFDSAMGETAAESFRIERDLRTAIAAGELCLHLQPQVHPDGSLAGAEVLVRWCHPERGLMLPGEFIPIAEQSNLIVDLGAWVLTESCRLMARERADGLALRLSVNVSPRHFRQRGFVPWLTDLLAQTGANPSLLTLEITEGLVIDNLVDVAVKMDELAALGIRFSIDDFGTGYSSLAYLKRLPIHELKIDKTFVRDAPTDANDAALVETILAVASHLQLQVVAEGVETDAQAAFLHSRARIIHQGYLYGRPDAASAWLRQWRRSELQTIPDGDGSGGENGATQEANHAPGFLPPLANPPA